jgi:hypothetical protein
MLIIQNSALHRKCPLVVYASRIFTRYMCKKHVDVMAIFKLRIRTKGERRYVMRQMMPARRAADQAIMMAAYIFPTHHQ